jgi:hypothetical protein
MAAKLLCARAGEDAAAFLRTLANSELHASRGWTESRTQLDATPRSSFTRAAAAAF